MKPASELAVVEPQAVARCQTAPPSTMLEIVARAAADPNTDVAKMERLYAMLEKENARRAEMAFNEAMHVCQGEMPRVLKLSKNSQTNSRYANLEAVNRVAVPVYTKHGFSMKFSESDCPNPAKIRVICRISHSGGHSEEHHRDLSPDDMGQKDNRSKTKIHGEASSFSYGCRYLICGIFNLTIVDEDDDGNQGRQHKPAGPSAMAPETPDLAELTKRIWTLLLPVRGAAQNWQAANEWLWREDLLDGAIPEKMPNLSATRMQKLLADATAKIREIA